MSITHLFHVLIIEQDNESVSGYCNTSSGQSWSDITRGTVNSLITILS